MLSIHELLQAVAGPIAGAIVGTLIIGSFITWTNNRSSSRRADYDLRNELVLQLTEAAGSFIFLARYYIHSREAQLNNVKDSEETLEARIRLGEQYRKTRVFGSSLEMRLQAYFPTQDMNILWHSAMDLASMAYFTIIKSSIARLETIYTLNAKGTDGLIHSGYTLEELREMSSDDYLDQAWQHVSTVARNVLSTRIIRMPKRNIRAQ